MSEENKWISAKEIAEHLGVRQESVYRWLKEKEMPGHKVGRHWKFQREEIDNWVRSGGAVEIKEQD